MSATHTPSLSITWQQPAFLLPLFCLCSLLGSTTSLAMALGLAVLVGLTTVVSSALAYGLSRTMPSLVSPALWLVCAAVLSAVTELLLHAWYYALYRQLGLFLPLSVISCLLVTRVEMQAEQISLRNALQRSLLMSAGYALAALVLGAGRELVGHGSLFADAASVFGDWAKPLELRLFRVDMGFLLAILAPGAFVALGLGVALYNWLWLQLQAPPGNTP